MSDELSRTIGEILGVGLAAHDGIYRGDTITNLMEAERKVAHANLVDFNEAADFYWLTDSEYVREKLHSVLAYLKQEHNEARFKYYHGGGRINYEALERMGATREARYVVREVLGCEFGEGFEQ